MSVSKPVARGATSDPAPAGREPFEAALGNLVAAIARRKIEPICVAYMEFRRSAGPRAVKHLLARLNQSVGRLGLVLVAQAFSRRRCYMCDAGSGRCRSCDGTGSDQGRPCFQCDGLGVERCDFCMGSGLADIDSAPEEFRAEAAELRLERLEKELAKLEHIPRAKVLHLKRFTANNRGELASWLIRLRGRLATPTGLASGNGHEHAERLAEAGERIDRLLEALRPDVPEPMTKGENEDE